MNSLWAFLASLALIRSILYNYLPEKLRLYISSRFEEWTSRFTTDVTMVFRDNQSSNMNQLFQAANLYLGESLPTISIPRVMVEKTENVRNLSFAMEKNSEMVDVFENVPMKWKYFSEYSQGMSKHEIRWYELSFHKEHKDMVTRSYLPHILERANKIKERNRVVKLHTAAHDFWTPKPVIIQHPMTFETLAMNGDLKKIIVEDLDRFMDSKEYYQQIGKVWKRGYLLHGPPGTGKSSLIAAMANHLNFDIYNLNLSAVSSDLVLQNLLLSMANRSLLAIEDIDCSVKLQNRESKIEQPIKYQQHNKVTLSGLLNFFDGIFSCCGEGKILVATTNYKERIDPALLRAGRMDMHIYLTYCTFSAFKQLALKYLKISDHSLFHHIEKLLPEVKVSPAAVAGELMKTRDPKASLEGLIKHLENKLLADGNSEVSPGHPSSHPSNCLVEESSISLPLASNETNMDNAKSPGPNPDVSADEQKATKESNLTENGPPEEDSNNSDKKDLLQGQSSGNNILEIIEDMEKELLSNKEAIIALLNKSTLTLNRLSKIKSNI
ncbi:P-loop containing nucleoside triphosphate hydrolases superfamily protein [Theobroma cacao]|uniref:P-loop containing nucleoside triphosphate hydrolases superfamily protein n=1 Tax=Theobroma cacao TaxID=3641 RepID=A0A061DGN4_THECC|nr:P-loop containing nucleoside triphosphate hydrolases superfamily protein [Theobroma cacao]